MIWLFLCTAVLLQATTAWEQDLKIRSCTAIEWNQSATPAPGGGNLYVWSDSRADDRNIYAQLVDANGVPTSNYPVAIDTKTGIQKNPVVTVTSDGFFVIAWVDTYLERRGDVFLQKINHQGQLLWTEGGIRASVAPGCSEIRLVTDNLGGVIVAWDRYDNDYNNNQSYVQSFAADGSRRWSESGIAISDENGYLLTSIISDGNNGFYATTSSGYSPTSQLFVQRYNTAGLTVWDNPIVVGSGNNIDMNRNGLLALGQDTFYLYWYQYTNDFQTCLLQAYTTAGPAIWPAPVSEETPLDVYPYPEKIAYSMSDNSVFLVTRLSGNYNGLHVSKINSGSVNLWGNVVVFGLEPYHNSEYGTASLEADGSGGAYLLWNKIYPATMETDIYAQHLSSTGAELWQPGGALVCNAPGYQYYPYLSVQGQNIWTAWLGQPSQYQDIRYQKLGNSGQALLESEGRYLFGGLNSMFTEGRVTLQRSNDVAMLWDDDRMGQNQSQIRLQTVNSSGAFGYNVNGDNITVYHPCRQYIVDARVLSNDGILVIWNEQQDYGYDLYAQLISDDGFYLWGDYGIQLTNNTDGYNDSPSIYEIGSDIFLAWTHKTYANNVYNGAIFMQKITNGQIQWAPGGISMLADAALCSNQLRGIYDDYLVYERRVLSQSGGSKIYALRFNPADGTPQTAWGTIGIPLDPANTTLLYNQEFLNAKLTPQGLFVAFKNISQSFLHGIMAQQISPNAQLLMGQSATPVMANITSLTHAQIQLGQNDFALAWSTHENQTANVKVQRFSYALDPLWEPLFVTDDGIAAYTICVTRDTNDALALVWTRNNGDGDSQIIYRFVSPSGALIGNDDDHQINCASSPITNLQTVNRGNRTMLTWSQGSSYYRDEPMEHQNLMGQMIINQTTAVDDPQSVPVALISTVTNYPNPFNPTTTISFKLAQATNVEIGIYNLKGQLVRTLLKDSKSAGLHHEIWNGLDAQGKGVGSGIYFYRINADHETRSGKMILIK